MRTIVLISLATCITGCVTVPPTPDASEPTQTFHAAIDFKLMGDCLYSQIVEYRSKGRSVTFPKTDFTDEVRFEEQVPVPYAVGREWMISVKASTPRTSEVRVYEGSRGVLSPIAEFYDSALPRFVRFCEGRKS